MSSKQQQSIRGTIHLLLSLLNECGIPRVASECFRRAKFNQEDVVDLWKLTFHIMQAVTFLDSEMCDGNLHEVVYHSITASNMRTVQMILRRYLFELGYHREEFYTPLALGSGVPSREVLLAFGWLLHRTAFFTKLRRHFLTVAVRHRVPTKQSHQHLIEHVIEENRVMGNEMDDVVTELRKPGDDSSTCVCVETLHKLVWFRGFLDSKWRAVQRACLAHRVLSDKIHRCTSVTSSISRTAKGYLSPHEVFLLRYPDQMKAYLSQLRQCIRVLEKLIQWGECESLLWQWMESILDLQEEEERGKSLNQDEERIEERTIPEYDSLQSTVCQLQEEFESLLSRNKPHTDRLGHVWTHKSSILSHKDLNGRLQRVRNQLQFEYPIAVPLSNQAALVTSTLEQIEPIDRPVYASVHTIVRKTGGTSVPLRQDSDARLVSVLSKHLQTVSQELKELDGEIGWRKREIGNAMESLEKTLPAAIYKIVRT